MDPDPKLVIPDTDPDLVNNFRSDQIRIHNTGDNDAKRKMTTIFEFLEIKDALNSFLRKVGILVYSIFFIADVCPQIRKPRVV